MDPTDVRPFSASTSSSPLDIISSRVHIATWPGKLLFPFSDPLAIISNASFLVVFFFFFNFFIFFLYSLYRLLVSSLELVSLLALKEREKREKKQNRKPPFVSPPFV